MASKVGALLIDMAMNTAAFASDLSKSQSALNSWASSSNKTLAGVVNGYRGLSKEMTDFTSRTFTLRNAILTLAGGGALGLLINKHIELASTVVDTADNIGVSTKTLQEYTYAASLSSVGTEQLQNAMTIFATSLGQAHAGAGKLYSYLDKSNPVLLQQVVNAKSVDEALDAVFTTMGKMTSQTDRLALAQAAFGKKNLELVNLVKDGTSAFEAMRQKANELGIVVRDDLLRNAEDAGDKIETLSQVVRAQLTVAVAENAAEIGHMAEELTKVVPIIINLATEALHFVNVLTEEWEPATIKIGAATATMAINAEKSFTAVQGLITGGWSEASAKIRDLDELAQQVAEEASARLQKIQNPAASPVTGGNVAAMQAASQATAGYTEKMRALAEQTNAAEDSFKKLQAAAEKIKSDGQSPFSNYINDVAQLDKMLKANLITWEEYQTAVSNAQEKNFHTIERTKKILGETQTAQEKYNATMAELNQLRGVEGGLSEEQYAQAVSKTTAELHKAQKEGSLFGDIMDKAIDGNIKSWRDLGMAVLDYGKQLLKSLAMGQGMGNAGGGFGGLGGLFGLASSAWSMYSTQSAVNASIAANPAIFHSGGKVGSAGGSTRRVDASMFANAPRFHSGGIVGDEVPIIAKKGERVLTEQQQKDGMGGTVVYSIDARGAAAGVEQRLEQMIVDLSNSIEPRSIKAVSNARARNPQLFGGR